MSGIRIGFQSRPYTLLASSAHFQHDIVSAVTSSSASPPPPTSGAGPQSLWPGFVSSTQALFTWWPTTQGGETSYNVYRNGTVVQTGIQPTTSYSDGSVAQPYFVDSGLTPSTTYTYTVSAIINGIETNQSPPLSRTTLAGQTNLTTNLTTPPAAVIDPATWIQPYALPTGTVHTAATASAFQAALNAANINGGDIIVMTAGNIFSGNFTVPAFTGINGWTYIISSQDPVYRSGGTLPGYSYVASNVEYTAYTCTAAIAAAATSATLSSAWTAPTGQYPTLFTPGTTGALQESQCVTYTQGTTAISWSVGLKGAATSTINVYAGNFVTPANLPSMPQIQFPYGSAGVGVTVSQGCTKVRFVGIAIQPAPSVAQQLYYCVEQPLSATPSESVYFDRCLFGNDSSSYAGAWGSSAFSFVDHGIGGNCNHALYHQCYFYGFADGSNGSGLPGADANGLLIWGGGPLCTQNCYVEAQAEGSLCGGIFIYQANMPNNYVFRYNYGHKPTWWQANGLGTGPKNHWELKAMNTAACYGNLFQNNWYAYASGGQHGRAIVLGARDQNASASGFTVTAVAGNTITVNAASGSNPFGIGGTLWLTGAGGIPNQIIKVSTIGGSSGAWTVTASQALGGTYTSGGALWHTDLSDSPWISVTDVDVYNNKCYNVGALGMTFTGDNGISCYTARVRWKNNIALINPGTDTHNTQTEPRALHLSGPCSDVTVDGNTFIINSADTHLTNTAFSSGLYWEGGGYPGVTAADRTTIINTILDGNYAVNNGSNVSGTAGLNSFLTNYTWNDNITILDTSSFPGTTFKGVAYTSIGFTSWAGPGLPPIPATNWNVTGGTGCGGVTCATASTTGGPIGAAFGTSSAVPTFVQIILQGVTTQGQSENGGTNGSVVAAPNSQTIGWHGVAGATGYNILRSMNGGASYSVVASNVAASAIATNYTNYVSASTFTSGFGTKNIAPGINCVWTDSAANGCLNTPVVQGPTGGLYFGATNGYTYTVQAIVGGVTSAQSAPSILPLIVGGAAVFIEGSFDNQTQITLNAANPGGGLSPLGFANSAYVVLPAYPGAHYIDPFAGTSSPQYFASVTGFNYLYVNIYPLETWAITDVLYAMEVCPVIDIAIYPNSTPGANNSYQLPSVPVANQWNSYRLPCGGASGAMMATAGSQAATSAQGVQQTNFFKLVFSYEGSTTADFYLEYYFGVE